VTHRVHGLYLIADVGLVPEGRLLESVRQALRGGASLVQYRNKEETTAAHMAELLQIREVCRESGIPLIINDDLILARELDADGVHLGRDDATIAEARRVLGPDKLIGASCYNEPARAWAARSSGADYVAFGSFFASPTKPEAVRAEIGVLHQARTELDLPIVAIGGITPENGASLLAAGADALAVASGVLRQADPERRARSYARLFERAGTER
jgi:thiamine-phosphate pyrophosphorylase